MADAAEGAPGPQTEARPSEAVPLLAESDGRARHPASGGTDELRRRQRRWR